MVGTVRVWLDPASDAPMFRRGTLSGMASIGGGGCGRHRNADDFSFRRSAREVDHPCKCRSGTPWRRNLDAVRTRWIPLPATGHARCVTTRRDAAVVATTTAERALWGSPSNPRVAVGGFADDVSVTYLTLRRRTPPATARSGAQIRSRLACTRHQLVRRHRRERRTTDHGTAVSRYTSWVV